MRTMISRVFIITCLAALLVDSGRRKNKFARVASARSPSFLAVSFLNLHFFEGKIPTLPFLIKRSSRSGFHTHHYAFLLPLISTYLAFNPL